MDTSAPSHMMLQAARLYYEDGRTQAEVAATLGISRPLVSRLLKQARDCGIVHIQVIDPTATKTGLGGDLVDAFGLSRAIVVASAGQSGELIRARLGAAAARHLEDVLVHGDVVGMGSGRTLYAMTGNLRPSRPVQATFVPLLGGLQHVPAFFQANELARMAAEAFHGEWLPLYTPAVLRDPQARAGMMASSPVGETVRRWAELTVAVVGIGSVRAHPGGKTLFTDYLDRDTQEALMGEAAAGGICLRYFTVAGDPCRELADRVVGLEVERLRSVRRVVAVAGGADKTEAILGALHGGYVGTLVTDEDTAGEILALRAAVTGGASRSRGG